MDDLISRQAAIDALDKRFDGVPMELTTEILELRRDLRERIPSAQPATSCSEIPNSSTDCISRQAVVKFFNDWISCLDENCHHQSVADMTIIKNDFKNLPSVQPKQVCVATVTLTDEQVKEVVEKAKNAVISVIEPERKRGEWIVWGGMDIPENHGRHICSLCGEFAPVRREKPLIKEYLSDFCPSCGADMRGEENG